MSKPQEIRLAFFGASQSGKTTLLASYFGNQQRHSFEQRNGYRLSAEKVAQGNDLLARYHGLEDGTFPAATDRFDIYRFAMKVGAVPLPAVQIVWYDYPGGWWQRDPADAAERAERNVAFRHLLDAHAGILVLDGKKYVADGMAYVRAMLDQFKGQIRSIQDSVAENGSDAANIPRIWMVAVSKADVLPPTHTAERIAREVVVAAHEELEGVAKAIGASRFGDKFLLLSSVRADGHRVMDAHQWIGLQLLAPLTLSAILDEVARSAGKGTGWGIAASVGDRLKSLVGALDRLDKFLPPQFQALTLILQAINLKEPLDKGTVFFREKQRKAAKAGKALEATVALMKAELSNPDGERSYYQNQADV